MKSKTFFILLALCAALAAAAYFVLNPEKPSATRDRTGQALLSGLPMGEVAAIDITGPKGEVTLKKGETVWTVENRYSFPADFSKLTNLADKLKEMKIGRSFSAADDALNRLALRPPGGENVPSDQQATRVILSDNAGKALAGILLGKAREASTGSGGHYVKPENEESIYLVDKDFKFLDTDPSAWLRKEIMNIPAEDVAQIECLNPGGEILYTLERPEKGGTPVFVNPPEGKKVIPSKINSEFGALSGFRIEDVADPSISSDKTGFEQGPTLKFRLFDGTRYTLRLGNPVESADNQRYFKAEAAFSAPVEPPAPTQETGKETPSEENSPADSDESASKTPEIKVENSPAPTADSKSDKKENPSETPAENAPDPEQRRAEVEKLNQDLSAWTYIVPGWKMDRFVTQPEDFFEKPESDTKTE